MVTAAKVKVYRLPVKAAQLQADIAAFRAPMEEGGRSWTVAAQKASRSLYQHLIAPARADLKGMKRLVVVPHRSLFYLPFAALDGGMDAKTRRYLIEDYAIVVVPSATVLRDIRNARSQIPNPKSPTGTLLAFAPFAEAKQQLVKAAPSPTRQRQPTSANLSQLIPAQLLPGRGVETRLPAPQCGGGAQHQRLVPSAGKILRGRRGNGGAGEGGERQLSFPPLRHARHFG